MKRFGAFLLTPIFTLLTVILCCVGAWFSGYFYGHRQGTREEVERVKAGKVRLEGGQAMRVWSCGEVFGPDPRPGYAAVLPPGWRMDLTGSAWDQSGRQVCRDYKPIK